MENVDIPKSRRLLETSLRWQKVIDREVTVEDKQLASDKALRVLGRIDGFYGTNRVLVKSELGLMIQQEELPELPAQNLEALRYRDLVLKGWLGKITSMQFSDYVTIAWPIFDAEILECPQQIEDRVRQPLYLPVGFIDYALCAA